MVICWKNKENFANKNKNKNLYGILEIFENFKNILKHFEQLLKKVFEISLFVYSFHKLEKFI